jgi:hypothetical protein
VAAAGAGCSTTNEVLGIIKRFDLKTQVEIFTAKTNEGSTFLAFIACHDPSGFRMGLNMTREFPLEIRSEVFTERDSSGWNLPMVAITRASGRGLLEPVMDAMRELSPNVMEEASSNKCRLGWSFPMLAVEYAPDTIGDVVDVMWRFRPRVQELILTAKGNNNLSSILLILMARRALDMLRRIRPMVGGLNLDAKVKRFMEKIGEGNLSTIFPIFVSEHVPDAIEIVLDMIDTLPPDVQVKISTAKRHEDLGRGGAGKTWTFLISIVHHSKNMLGNSFGMVDRLGRDARESILLDDDLALPVWVFRNGQDMMEMIIDMIAGCSVDAQGRAFTHVIDSIGSRFPIHVLRRTPLNGLEKIAQKILGIMAKFSPYVQKEVFAKGTFRFEILAYLKSDRMFEKTFDMIDGFGFDTQVWTFEYAIPSPIPLLVARYVPKMLERVLSMAEKFPSNVRKKMLEAREMLSTEIEQEVRDEQRAAGLI